MAPSATTSCTPSRGGQVIATNTLLVTNLDRDAFLVENLAELRRFLEQHGTLREFVPIRSFTRVLAVFYQTADATQAKRFCDRTPFLGMQIRIFYGLHTPNYKEPEESRHLTVPDQDKNWLLSPPGSPPTGWTPAKETGPNTKTLADDLAHALVNVPTSRLGCQFKGDHSEIDDEDLHSFSLDGNQPATGLSIKVPTLVVVSADAEGEEAPTNANVSALPMILIQDWDSSAADATPLPSVRHCNLQQSRTSFPSLMRRPPTPTPTPRPPIY